MSKRSFMNLLKKISEVFYPTCSCYLCHKELYKKAENYLCEDCVKTITPCDKALTTYGSLKVYSACKYSDGGREIVLNSKDHDKPYLFKVMAGYVNDTIELNELKADMVTFVPSNKKSVKRRGYELMKDIAKEVSKKYGIEYVVAISRRKDILDQTAVPRENRYSNVKGAFQCVYNVENKTVIIIDDLVTTGATLNECANILLNSGAKSVIGVTFSRASSN